MRLEQTGPGPTATGPTSSGRRFSQLRFDVRQTIDGAAATAQEAGKILRDDARLLLLFAFNELVARPISTVRPGTENLEEYIDSDIRAITSRAIELSETDEVSAHNIVDATSGSWDSLLTARNSRSGTKGPHYMPCTDDQRQAASLNVGISNYVGTRLSE